MSIHKGSGADTAFGSTAGDPDRLFARAGERVLACAWAADQQVPATSGHSPRGNDPPHCAHSVRRAARTTDVIRDREAFRVHGGIAPGCFPVHARRVVPLALQIGPCSQRESPTIRNSQRQPYRMCFFGVTRAFQTLRDSVFAESVQGLLKTAPCGIALPFQPSGHERERSIIEPSSVSFPVERLMVANRTRVASAP